MNESDSLLWDNDPAALPKTPEQRLQVMTMVYSHMQRRGVDPTSAEAMMDSPGFTMTYSDWLASRQ